MTDWQSNGLALQGQWDEALPGRWEHYTRVWYAMYAHTDGHERKTARLSFTGN
jgi:hypothetical protein